MTLGDNIFDNFYPYKITNTMEPLLPSEVARLIYGYLKKELNEDTAECFLKTSPHLKECYQMFQVNRNFNCKVNGFSLHDIFEQFGAMCSLINEHISEDYESRTLIEKLQYLLRVYNKTHKIDKCIETEFDCNYDSNRNVTAENNTSPTRSVATTLENLEINLCKEVEKSNFISSKSHVSSCSLIDTTANVNNNNEFNSIDITNHSSVQISQCETPSKLINSSKKCLTPKAQQTSFNNLPFVSQQNASDFVPSDCIQIPEATPLDSMPGLAKEEKPKETSIIVDTGELVDTFLKDKSLLEKIANNINKSLEIHDDNLEQSVKILDQPSLEKAIDSTQSDPQIKNILDEFLVFNVNNDEETSKNQPDNLQSSIKSRLRSAKKKDDTPNKIKKNINNSKHISSSNEECKKIEDSIILIGESNNKSIYIDNYPVLSNQIILQSNISSNGQSYTLDSSSLTPEIIHEEDYPGKSNYVKIAPKITPLYLSQQGQEKHFFPKRKRRTLGEFGVRSKFRRTNLAPIQPMNSIKPTPSIVIQVPNQSTLDEAQSKNDIFIENIIRLPDITKEPFKAKENISHDTPDDRLKPPQNRSMSTPRRRSTHIRCLDFSTPQPKNSLKNNARSKLFNDSPKKNKKIEEPPHSPIPKLQADWGSVNGFESMVKNNNVKKHWDSDIREMVGAGILTSDADARSRKSPRKKKTPKKRVNLNKNVEESKSLNNKQSKLVSDKLLTNKNHVSNNEVVEKNEETSLLNEKISKNSSDIKKIQNDSSNINHNEQPKQTNFNTCYTQENENSLIVEENFTANINNTRPSIDETAVNFTENTIMSSNLKQVENSLKHNSSNNVILSLCDLNNSFENSIKDSKTVISKEITTINLETPFKNLETPLEISKENCIKDVKKSSQCNQLESKTYTNGQNNQSIILDKLNSNSFENSKVVSKNNYATLINPVIFNSETGSNTMNTPSSDCVLVENPCINNFTSPTQLENKTVENVKSTVYQNLPNLEDNKKLCELSNSIKNIESKSQSNKHIIIETPCKCDDSAVDVPETPISKLLRECDPSKLMTPIASSPFNCEESLETPLTKVFRETSYLNRPPISPFPPTPGNSRSVDTIISLPSQELNINFNNQQKATIFNSESKLNNSKEISVSKHEVTLPNKNKSLSNIPKKNKAKNSIQRTKNESAIELKNIEDKKKQVYESVKIELFGSEISSSSSGDELDKKKQYDNFITTNSLTKKLEIPFKKEKKSGFKLIPQRMHIKAAQPFSCDVIQPLNMVTTKSQLTNFPKPKLFSHVESYNTNKKTMKSMVHFDDPVEIIMNGTPKNDQNQSSIMTFSQKNISKKSKLNTIETPEPLIGLSRYLSKPSTPYKCRADEKLTIPSTKKKSILNENNSYEKNIFNNTSHNLDKNSEESYHLNKNETRPSLSSVKNTSYVDNDDEVKLMSINSKLNLNNSQANSVLTQSINYFSSPKTCDKSGSTINSNTSCITIGHNETSKSQSILPDQICLADFFKSPKIYEIITEDDEREVVCIQLSPNFDLLNIPSELNNFQQNISPLISKNLLNVTSELEDGELVNDVENLMTSTPKEIYDKKNVDKQSRIRRSPSFWEDSIHYLYKYRDDKHKDTSYRRSNNYRENRYEQKYRQTGLYSSYRNEYSLLDCRNKYQRSHFSSYSKREPREESVREKDKYKIKEDRRRNSRDYRAYDDYKRLDETERRGVSLKISQNDTQKSIRVDDILKKATKRSKSRTNINEIPSKISKVEHQRLLKNVNVDDFLSIVHGQ